MNVTVGQGGRAGSWTTAPVDGGDGSNSEASLGSTLLLRAGGGRGAVTNNWVNQLGTTPSVGSLGTVIGGGAGGNGATSTPAHGSAGGNGVNLDAYIGVNVSVGGGGGGGSTVPAGATSGAAGGSGGGGRGSSFASSPVCSDAGQPGAANTGGGGGGGSANDCTPTNGTNGVNQRTNGGSGGSGVVYLRFTPPAKIVPQVAVADEYGNVLSNAAQTTVTAAIAAAPQAGESARVSSGFVSGSVASVNTTNGESVFSSLYFTGDDLISHRLSFTAPGLQSVTSNTFNLVHGEAAQFEIVSGYSTDVVAGSSWSNPISIRLKDLAGNLTTRNNTTTISVVVASGSGGSLTNSEVVVTGGIATFSNLALFGTTTPAGGTPVGYTLKFRTDTLSLRQQPPSF